MGKKTYFWLTAGAILLLLAALTVAQEEQWLQYRSAREAREIIGDISSQSLKMISEQPKDVKLPDFKNDDPLFFKWLSPMVKSGHLWIALDRTHSYGGHDLLYIDSNGDGHLKDDAALTAYQTELEHSYFGPAKVTFEGEDGLITYHLNFRLCDHGQRWLYASPGGWYEGTIQVAGEKKHCVLIDYNVNGTFNDKSLDFGKCDRLRIGKKDGRDTRFVGNYIEVEGIPYRPEIARDGAYIKIAKAEDITFGTVRVPETISDFAAGGENGLLSVALEKGIGQLPVGKYRVHHWSIERKDEKGNSWELKGQFFSNEGIFNVDEGGEVKLAVGEPITSTLQVEKGTKRYSFSQNLKGRLGEPIEITRNGKRPKAPKLHIKSKDGTYDRTFTFEYG